MIEDGNQQIIAELRSLSTVSRRIFWLVLVFVVVGLVTIPFSSRFKPATVASSWDSVAASVRRQDLNSALREAQTLVAKEPNYYYGHSYLGMLYLATGQVTEAEKEYATAYQLFPAEQQEKDLAAVRKRIGEILRPKPPTQ